MLDHLSPAPFSSPKSEKTQEMLKIQSDYEQQIIKLKTESSQAISKLTGTIVDRKKKEKEIEENKTKLEANANELQDQMVALKTLNSEQEKTIESLKHQIDELTQLETTKNQVRGIRPFFFRTIIFLIQHTSKGIQR